MYEYAARLLRVVDACNVDLDVDLGFGVHVRQRIRLAGVTCYARGTLGGDDATQFTRTWLHELGPELTLRTVLDRREEPGQYLGSIIADARTLNVDLITAGHAVGYGCEEGRDPLWYRGEADPTQPLP